MASTKAYQGVFRNAEEMKNAACTIKGAVPLWLNGSIIRNGPGEFDVGEESFKHWFDGHALIHKFDIAGGQVTYTSNFVKSEDYKINHQNERIILASFGTTSMPDPCKNIFSRFFARFVPAISQNANVNMTKLGKTYYAITDGPWANRINSETLDTEEYLDFRKLLGVNASTAHPHFDENGDYYNLGLHNRFYAIYKIPLSSMATSLNPLKELQIFAKVNNSTPFKPCYFHSFAMSENYITLHDHPIRISVLKLITMSFTMESFSSALEHHTDKESVFHVVDKRTQKTLPIQYCSVGRFSFHHINSYEQTVDDKTYIIVDIMCADGPTVFYFWLRLLRDQQNPENDNQPHTWPLRFVIPLDVDRDTPKGENLVQIPGCEASAVVREDGSVFLTPERLLEESSIEKFGLWAMDLPTVNYKECNTKPYTYMYSVGMRGSGNVLNTLLKVNVQTKEVKCWKEEGYYPSEPIFVKNPEGVDEDDGVVLSSVVNENPEDPIFLLVLDAKTFNEIARAEVFAKLTYPFHGFFDGNQFGKA